MIIDPAVPEAAIAYPQDMVLASYARAGLSSVLVHPGEWCGREKFLSGQDIVVASKTLS